MPEPKLIVYEGPPSQTGLAVNKQFPDIDPQWKDKSVWKGMKFDDIKTALLNQPILAVLPMWNSHKGEIDISHAFEMIFEQLVRLHALWPKSIIFECVGKNEIKLEDVRKIVSVSVAAEQCSKFVQDLGAEFIPAQPNSTPAAYKIFKDNADIHAVLCAPGLNEDNFKVLCKNASNPVNFTTFALLASLKSQAWDESAWGSLYDKLNPAKRVYFGVQMPMRNVAFSDDQKALFNELTAETDSIKDIPNILFVTKRSPDKCGLLIEAEHKTLPDDILTDEGYSTEIEVIQDIGGTNSKYSDTVYPLLSSEFYDHLKHDFIKHRSVKNYTCFFACPPLEIIMHGFEENVVEPVMRLLIDKYFELYNNGIRCTEIQKEFFEKYNEEYLEHGMDFIKFVDIGTMI
jgi:hypothetical protein